jgi:ferredoxin
MTQRPRSTRSPTLVVDPIACRAHGLCAEMLPDVIRLDEWGYPILGSEPVTPDRERDARAAVRACPTLALRLRRREPS